MAPLRCLALGLLASLASEASALATMESTRVLSKAEIMATMTTEKALALARSRERLRGHPQLLALVDELKGETHSAAQAGEVQRHSHHAAVAASSSNGTVDGAKKMLNEMMVDAQAKLDNEEETCSSFNRDTLAQLEEIRQDVASFNSQAAQARSLVLKAQAAISFVNLKLPQVDEELVQHNDQCRTEEGSINAQLGVIDADLEVMQQILTIIGKCPDKATLIQCPHCSSGAGYVMLQDKEVQPLIKQLRSSEARKSMQVALGELYKASTEDDEAPKVFFQLEARKLRGHQDPDGTDDVEEQALNVTQVPEETTPVDCEPTSKCTLGAGSCIKIKDRFLNILSNIQDLKSQLKDDLSELQENCETTRKTMESQIANLGEKLRNAQTDLGTSTKDQIDSESSSNLKGQQHQELTHEYGKRMKECCDEQNDLRSELCALEKIRGEMMKLKGADAYITDCEVSDFKAGECSASCGGGTRVKTRSILVHPAGGMACPPLQMTESCNPEPCPINCVVGDWEGWSGCSADCGGGVRERTRPVLQEMQYDGEPCEDTEETEGCNSQSCNADCVLGDWDSWSPCSQACGGGTNRRQRGVAVPPRGTGTCPAPDADRRLRFRDCNTGSCKPFKHMKAGHGWLMCGTKLDLVILMDGSGSLGEEGFAQSKTFVTNLLENFKGGEDFVKVAVQLFSGPEYWDQYDRCTGVSTDAPDMEKDCGIFWLTRYTANMEDAIAAVKKPDFPGKTTLTSVALAEAESQLVYGREDASTVVLVVTDGKPLSHERTKAAAERLMQKARIIWVPVGVNAPVDLVSELASLPQPENIVHLEQLNELTWRSTTNQIIKKMCPVLA